MSSTHVAVCVPINWRKQYTKERKASLNFILKSEPIKQLDGNFKMLFFNRNCKLLARYYYLLILIYDVINLVIFRDRMGDRS